MCGLDDLPQGTGLPLFEQAFPILPQLLRTRGRGVLRSAMSDHFGLDNADTFDVGRQPLPTSPAMGSAGDP
jgi:hypothetical protein